MNRTNDLKPFSTYILSNYNKTVLYIGITNDLKRRICEHKSKLDPNSFTAKYNVDRLVYFEQFQSINDAIAREKQIKHMIFYKKTQNTLILQNKSLQNNKFVW